MPAADTAQRQGFTYALAAFAIWGLILPIYMKLLADVSPLEIVGHRIIWAIPFAMLILWWQGLLGGVWRHFTHLRTLALATLTAVLISVNWGTYVYAIVSGHAVEAALGYYINPLVNVVLGALVLGERPNRIQSVAIGLAAIGVAILTVKAGGLPWISLILAFSFGTYGLLRKMVPVGASEGFFLEVAILSLPSVLLIAFMPGESHFLGNGWETAMLIGAGPLTAVPLILYAAGARLLHYSTIGILQYAVPTLLFLTAVFIFGEPFSAWQLVAFAFIWAALILYTVALFRSTRAERRERQGTGAVLPAEAPLVLAGAAQPPSDQRVR
ncbi:EamA family transporter RarD [Aurantimonas sp. HBX-1]|uniref:EamA family transporter RarD n=1 Tax=Aurantimonas sp. HBX-1 TaxID=2906072 RepID=UPI001F3D6D31|nr:EamA family transporter RarD [Aurantimonas sp. HBX-1]UIJ73087.1 EamA family transporter RarD [Aurantimonas sp. HBX-1]